MPYSSNEKQLESRRRRRSIEKLDPTYAIVKRIRETFYRAMNREKMRKYWREYKRKKRLERTT